MGVKVLKCYFCYSFQMIPVVGSKITGIGVTYTFLKLWRFLVSFCFAQK